MTLALSGCGPLGGTELETDLGSSPIELRWDDPDLLPGNRYLSIQDVNLCTTGDDEVTITGVRLRGADAPEVVGFRVYPEPTASVQSGVSSGSSQLTKTARNLGTDSAAPFRQSCDDGRTQGRTSLTFETELGDLPAEVDQVSVLYEVDGDEKSLDIPARIVVCLPESGCPPESDDDL